MQEIETSVAAIVTSRLTRTYGPRRALDGVDLRVETGRIFGFLGPNGAGKTTMIRLLLGLLRPTGGSARVFDMDCWRESHRLKRRLGYLPGDVRLYSWWTAQAAVRWVSRIRGMSLEPAGRELAERFDLPWTLRVSQMSRGTRQKLGLLLALVHRPPLLILDEPTTGLDPPMRHALSHWLREHARQGNTVFFSSHTLSEVEQLCDEVAIVRQGRLVAHAPIDSLREQAGREVVIWFSDSNSERDCQPPDFLKIRRREPLCWYGHLRGPTPPLVRWAAQQPIADIAIGKPDLESVFRSFYEEVD